MRLCVIQMRIIKQVSVIDHKAKLKNMCVSGNGSENVR